MAYIGPEIESSPTEIENEMYEYIQSVYPDWEPREGHLAVLLSEAIAQQVDELLTLAAEVPSEIFRYFGSLVGVFPQAASTAQGATTWTMIDNLGHTIPAGTSLRILVGTEDFAIFQTIDDIVVAPGDTVTDPGEVLISAVESGSFSSGLSGTIELIDILDFVSSVALVGATSGGVDEEDEDVYLDSLSDRLQLMADRPILAEDFAIYANTVAGVFRTTAIDNYDPATDTYDNEKMVAVAAVDETGGPVSGLVKAEIEALLESVREVNFIINVIDPDYSPITIDATVVTLPGYDTAIVEASVESALEDYLNPATWGASSLVGGTASDTWLNETKVRFFEIVTVINNVDGVNYIEPGTLEVNGVAADFTMTGAVALPALNPTLNITANTP